MFVSSCRERIGRTQRRKEMGEEAEARCLYRYVEDGLVVPGGVGTRKRGSRVEFSLSVSPQIKTDWSNLAELSQERRNRGRNEESRSKRGTEVECSLSVSSCKDGPAGPARLVRGKEVECSICVAVPTRTGRTGRVGARRRVTKVECLLSVPPRTD